MALSTLATTADVMRRMAVDLTVGEQDRLEALLEDASAAVRSRAGIDFTEGTTTKTFEVFDGNVRLAQRPVTDVSLVTDIDGHSVQFYWDGSDRVLVPEYLPLALVTYSYGYDEIPSDIVAVVCQMAARAYGVPSERSGITQETTGPYSYTTGGAAAAGGIGMLAAEQEVVDRYRRQGGSIRVARSHRLWS